MGCFLNNGRSPVVLEVEDLLDVGRSAMYLKYPECQYGLVTMVNLLLTAWGLL